MSEEEEVLWNFATKVVPKSLERILQNLHHVRTVLGKGDETEVWTRCEVLNNCNKGMVSKSASSFLRSVCLCSKVCEHCVGKKQPSGLGTLPASRALQGHSALLLLTFTVVGSQRRALLVEVFCSPLGSDCLYLFQFLMLSCYSCVVGGKLWAGGNLCAFFSALELSSVCHEYGCSEWLSVGAVQDCGGW